ncbi:MAG: V-type ATP synthase subunit A, partial [Candidatus Omnitrophica bacterium]|nr:V-type ATP synthase subunit A [Candidatus Omnitrophota bacterium]
MSKRCGNIKLIQGNMICVGFDGEIIQNEVGHVICNQERLMAEVIKISGNIAYMQVFEDTKGIKVGDMVEFSGQMLSIELGPGLLGQVYDGLQNPLHKLAEEYGVFLPRGIQLNALDYEKKWHFKPVVQDKKNKKISRGIPLGYVQEGIFKHYIMVPFNLNDEYELEFVASEGDYKIKDTIARIKDEKGQVKELNMVFDWPIKIPIDAY